MAYPDGTIEDDDLRMVDREIRRLRAERAELLAALEAMRVVDREIRRLRAFDEAKIIAARKGEENNP